MITAIAVTFMVLMVIGTPIAFVMGGAALAGIVLSPDGMSLLPVLPQQIFKTLDSFPFLTIPLFIFAGAILAEGGVAERLMKLASLTVGRGRGGLGASIVFSALFFHGISGSSSADTAAIAKVTLPSLKRENYPLPFSTALLAAAGATSTLIPPSTDLILIGVIANISIAGLFAAGLIPAIVNACGLVLLVILASRRHGYGIAAQPFAFRQAARAFFEAVPGLFMIVIILGGILGGVFTPTEASAVAVVYGLFVTLVVYRTLTVARLVTMIRETVEISGMVLLVIAMSALLSFTFTLYQVPAAIAAALDAVSSSSLIFLLLVQLVFFSISMVMDTIPALLVLMPILTPMAIARGIEPIHFGILVETNVALALAHPPAGNCLFTACAVAKVPIERVIRPLLPMIGILIVTMMMITYIEGFSMFLPRLLNLTD